MIAFEITILIMCWISVAVCLFGLVFSVVECIKSRREERPIPKKPSREEVKKCLEILMSQYPDEGHDSKGDKK